MPLEAPELLLVLCPLPHRIPCAPEQLVGHGEDDILLSGKSPGCPPCHWPGFSCASTTALWDPPVGSQRGILLPEGCREHVPL